MNKELGNPMFKFLFENQSPEHIYYRWRLFSILEGETKDNWNQTDFRMFQHGSIWRPPVANVFTSGMPKVLLDEEGASIDPADRERSPRSKERDEEERKPKPVVVILPGKKPLTDDQRDSLEGTLRALEPDRNSIAESMVWCIEQAECAEEVVECITESLSILETPIVKKIARLFLISDILHNCTVKGVPMVSFYRTSFQTKLPEVFADLHKMVKNLPERRQAEAFKQRVMSVFSAWEDWHLYPMDFLIKCQNMFLGLVTTADEDENGDEAAAKDTEGEASDDDVDGMPLEAAAAALAAKGGHIPGIGIGSGSESEDSDPDGKPLDDVSSITQRRASPAPPPPAGAFIKSKWETVDPEQVKAQAVTTSKWEREDNDELQKARKALMGSVASKWEKGSDEDGDSLDGEPLARGGASDLDLKAVEKRREILRDIENKVMAYQDELETGEKGIKSGWTIAEQVEHYRKKLTRKATDNIPVSATNNSTSNRNNTNHHSTARDRAEQSDHSDADLDKSSRGSKKKKRKRDRSSSSGGGSSLDRSRGRSRSRDRKNKKKQQRDRSASVSPDRRGKKDRSSRSPKRSKRSRSRSAKKSKKKRR